jgi:hypothetical protein
LVGLYPPVKNYVEAVGTTLYPEMQATPDGPLARANRERCVLAVLGGRQESLNLAVHIYLALVNGVSPGEIAHILALAGVYGGMGSFAHSLDIEKVTLEHLKTLYRKPADPLAVFIELKTAFTR